jgi:hypothetical protein
MAIGDVRPREDQASDDENPQAAASPISADVLHRKGQHPPAKDQQGGSAIPEGGNAAPSTSAAASLTPAPTLQGLNLEPIFEQEEAKGPEEE